MIEKQAGKALYSEVKDRMIELIRHKPPHSKLPTEAEFCERFAVSRTTIRTALQELALEGYVYKQQGKGTFVANHKVDQILTSTVESFQDQLLLQGKQPNIRVVQLEVVPANEKIAGILNVKVGEPVNRLERLRYANEEPLQYEVAYLPWSSTPGLQREGCEQSLYRLLDHQFSLKIHRTVEQIELIHANHLIASQLSILQNDPCFYLETIAYLADDQPIEYSETVFRGDRARFVVERNYNHKG
ncbi:transcriptional regulator, GntR family [Seinonella peptonophila]|uniref:Transcriptional regulator, GntR family n=1 Tax=Seinonella peptonophila TaxID=112248 RepID=A0A1M4VK24_9BACL|nr:GntR family transcriptional regulator [Seinonella peptonophila]SHE69349.1 transcriptional regulator, GntR family [Seinonella peptonophila]